jgi:hypothetical protein
MSLGKHLIFEVSSAFSTNLENPREIKSKWVNSIKGGILKCFFFFRILFFLFSLLVKIWESPDSPNCSFWIDNCGDDDREWA